MRLDMWTAPVSGSVTPGILRFTFSSQSQIQGMWSVLEVENADPTTPIRQSDPSASSGARGC